MKRGNWHFAERWHRGLGNGTLFIRWPEFANTVSPEILALMLLNRDRGPRIFLRINLDGPEYSRTITLVHYHISTSIRSCHVLLD
ncbi:hypothetical protein Poly41_34630 [Novipirellula artificiosorum]|uniref:Uncharacterized protein n=1 Tax=Novipirellula artificiosorum TaxID=2528016 RepID=A0A5C6DIW8_9BACT|nr:hypothetical protein Poly41_34630 [Novipirellula artificiosorum]